MKRGRNPTTQGLVVLEATKAALRENIFITGTQLRDIISPMASDQYVSIHLHHMGLSLGELRKREVARLKGRIKELEASL